MGSVLPTTATAVPFCYSAKPSGYCHLKVSESRRCLNMQGQMDQVLYRFTATCDYQSMEVEAQ